MSEVAGPITDGAICDYLKQLLPGWMQGDTATGLACAFASALQAFMDLAMDARDQTFPAQADDQALSVLGRDRALYQFVTETAADFRKRLTHAFEIHKKGGTRTGVDFVLSLLLPDTTYKIHEFGPDSWHLGKSHLGVDTYLFDSSALFTFRVDVFATLADNLRQALSAALRQVKAAHTTFFIQEVQ